MNIYIFGYVTIGVQKSDSTVSFKGKSRDKIYFDFEVFEVFEVYKIKPVLYILCADGFWKIGLDFVLFIQIFLASKKKCPKIHKLLIESILKYGQIDACQVLIGR